VSKTIDKKTEEEAGHGKSKKAARGGGGYQSNFLKEKVEEQKNRSRANRRSGGNLNTAAVTGTRPRARGAAAHGDEALLEVIEGLQNEQALRDQEYEDMREKSIELQEQNEWLRAKVLEEREARMTLEAKLNKIINMKEID
jgi:hypothetical protein